MKSKFTIQLALAVVLTFEFSNATYAAPPADACSLLTADQVSKVLAVSVKNGERVVANSPKMCGWAGPGGPSNSKRVVASIITLDTFDHENTAAGNRRNAGARLGDDAHYMTTPGFGTGLSVKKGSSAFKIKVYGALHSLPRARGEEGQDYPSSRRCCQGKMGRYPTRCPKLELIDRCAGAFSHEIGY